MEWVCRWKDAKWWKVHIAPFQPEAVQRKEGFIKWKTYYWSGRWKRQRKSGSKGKWKRLFLQEKFSPVSVIFFDHFIETRSRLYFQPIDWIEVIDSLKPDKTRESENLWILKKKSRLFQLRMFFWLSTFLGNANCKVVLANWSNWLLCLLKVL